MSSTRSDPTPALALTVLLIATGLAGCAGSGSPADGTDADPRFDSLDDALEAAGPTLVPSQPADSPIRAEIVSPISYQALAASEATELVVVLHDPIAAEAITDATVALDAGPPTSARLAEDGHGVYAGEIVVDDAGERPARLTAILDDGRSVVFDLELRAWSSTQDAKAAEALSYEPVSGDEDLRLRLVEPEATFGIDKSARPLTFVLYDAQAGEVVPDADVDLESWMPPHGLPGGDRMQGHGTHGEVAPTHERFGVYQGRLDYVMNGTWWTNVTVDRDGTETRFRMTYDIGSGGHSHGDGQDDGHAHSHGFETFLGALSSHGPEREMASVDGSASLTAKLLQPAADGAPQGDQPVKILLTQPEADRPAPVAMGHVELDIHRHTEDGGIEDAKTSEVVHSGHGIWTAQTNLTEESSWEFHLDVETFDGDVFTGSFQVTVGSAEGGGHDHSGHDH